MNYYCLMAGAPDLTPGQTMGNGVPSVSEFREQAEEELCRKDKELLDEYLFLQTDCRNLASLLEDSGAELPTLGNHSREELVELMALAREAEGDVKGFSPVLSHIVRQWDAQHETEGFFAQDQALYAFLQNAVDHCPNATIRQWHRMQMDMANVLTALLARNHGWNPAQSIVGEGVVQDCIRQNPTASDFGLSVDLEYVQQLVEIAGEDDPVQKERKADALKWTWLDDRTFFVPFGIESVFARLCQLEMLERWSKLDSEQGKQRFEQIIENLRGEARVPQEFVKR
ncbi:MAG: DUF2764 domain-containing protein [Bacteroidaceae bacterium]|nr:DUF2764 domain-containing protein [Bacteroidaceae bacterium]